MHSELITVETSAAHRDAALALATPFFETLGDLTPVACSELPADYKTLLCHAGHMTVTLEAWHESLVDVQVVGEVRERDAYTRHSLLARQSDGHVVQSGVMRIDLSELPMAVRAAIEVGESPLGRILIRSNLLREVELLALWRITPGEQLATEIGVAEEVIYGRTARILVEGRPAVELLEIVRP